MGDLGVGTLVDAGTVGVLAALVVLLVRRQRPEVASSTERWIERLEGALDQAERRELVRETNDALHRAWDTEVLLIVATAADAATIRERLQLLGPPPRLTPEPSEWLTARSTARRRRARRAAAPIAPEVPEMT